MTEAIQNEEPMIIAVGTANAAKLRAVRNALDLIYPNKPFKVHGEPVSSGVSDQPLSDEECIRGATNRAAAAFKLHPNASFAIGIEGGAQQIGNKWFESGWIVVQSQDGKIGTGSSGRYELSKSIMKRIIEDKQELATVIDDLSGLSDVRSNQGAMGLVTNGHVSRDIAYLHGILFAFGPFISSPRLWE